MDELLSKPARYAWWMRAIISKALTMRRPGRDGRFRTRFAVIMHTEREWRDRLLHDMVPLDHRLRLEGANGPCRAWWSIPVSADEMAEVEIIFLVRNRPDFIARLRGIELTGACLIDGPGVWGVRDRAVIASRTGRYPSVLDGGEVGDSWVVTASMAGHK